MPAIFFVYGLAFIILGVALLFFYRGRKDAHRLIANSILIAAFGLLHGINEWLDMLILIRKGGAETILHWLRFLLLPLSFLFLLLFAVKTIGEHRKKRTGFKLIPLVTASVWLSLTAISRDHFLMGEIWARYFLAIPGTFLTAYALLLEEEGLREKVGSALTGYIALAAGAFIFYGMFAGMVVPKAEFFPASLINTSLLYESGGIPVQILRTLCAVTIAYGLTQALGSFPPSPKEKGGKGRKTEGDNRGPENLPKEGHRNQTPFEAMAAALDDGICIQDKDQKILYQNPAHKELLGDHLGKYCYAAFERRAAPCTECPVTRSLEDGRIHRGEKVTMTNEGIRHLKLNAVPLTEPSEDGAAVVQAVRDLTDYQKMEEDLFKLDKIESIELMAAGIAHDLNNLMTTILVNIDRIKCRTDSRKPNI